MMTAAWKYYLKYFTHETSKLRLAFLAGIFQAFLLFPIAFLVREAFQKAIPEKQPQQILLLSLSIFFLYLCNGGIILFARRLALDSTKKVIENFRLEMLLKFHSLPQSYYADADKGRLHAMVVQDTHHVDVMSNLIITHLTPALAVIGVLGAVLIYLNWFLFGLMIIIIPGGILLTRRIGVRLKALCKEQQEKEGSFSSAILLFLQTLDLARIHSAEQYQMKNAAGTLEEFRKIGIAAGWWESAYIVRHDLIGVTATVVILLGGGISIVSGWMTVPEMLSFIVATMLLRGYISTASRAIPRILEGNEALLRLYNLMNLEDRLPYPGTNQIAFSGDVKLEDVSFRYRENTVLRSINFHIERGEIVLLNGPNGSGKSTLVNLILGLYRPEEGNVYSNNLPYEKLDLVSLRRQMGVVMQNPILIPGTIQENITYGCSEVNQNDLIDAATQASAHDFISRLPQGYQTPVGENGLHLSGGERQRIAIARALYRKPSLLILDEPTNHLDPASVTFVLKNLQSLPQSPSVLIVTHELVSYLGFHRVYRLEEGTIRAAGASPADRENLAPMIH